MLLLHPALNTLILHRERELMEQMCIRDSPTCDCGTFDVTQTQIYGKPAPDAACVMAFFDMTPGVQLV